MADIWEVAHHLARCLDAAKAVSKVEVSPQDFGPAVAGKSPLGRFYIQLWPTPEDALKGVQAIAMPPGGKSLHLGFWQPLGGVEGTVQQVVKALWAELVEQDRENRELERVAWVPVAKLPRVKYESAPARVVPSVYEHASDPEVTEVATEVSTEVVTEVKTLEANIGLHEPATQVSTPEPEEIEEEGDSVLGIFGV